MNELEYIKEDLKKANITDFSIENKHLYNIPEVIEVSNSIIYVILIIAKNTEDAVLTSFDFDVNINKRLTNESIFKFLNDFSLVGVKQIKYIKVNFIKNPENAKQ